MATTTPMLLLLLFVLSAAASTTTAHGDGDLLNTRQSAASQDAGNPFGLRGLFHGRHLHQANGSSEGENVAGPERFEYFVKLLHTGPLPACGGGVLISENWVATSAECVPPSFGSPRGGSGRVQQRLVIGAIDSSNTDGSNQSELFLGDIFIHPSWDGNPVNGNNIALIRLPVRSLKTSINVAARKSVFRNGDSMHTIGFGREGEENASRRLKWGSLSFLDNEQCGEDPTLGGGAIRFDVMCAVSSIIRPVDACQGDAGGPLILAHTPKGVVRDGRPNLDVVVGLMSTVNLPPCDAAADAGLGGPIVFTRISEFRDWMDDVMLGRVTEVTPPVPATVADDGCGVGVDCEDLNESLLDAAYDGDFEAVKRLLEKEGVDVDFKGEEDESTPLILSVSKGFSEVARLLIREGADVDLTNIYGETALMVAAQMGDVDLVWLLTREGANKNRRNEDGDKAIDIICSARSCDRRMEQRIFLILR